MKVDTEGFSGPLDLLAFSRQMLRGMALQAQQQWPQAEAHWQQLLAAKPDALQQQLLQLALAMTLERADKLDALFAAQSLVTRDELRDPLLRFSASAPLLRQARVLLQPRLLLVYAMTAVGYGGSFIAFTFLAPILQDISGFSASTSAWCCWSTASRWPQSYRASGRRRCVCMSAGVW